jgi:hypothetical protein
MPRYGLEEPLCVDHDGIDDAILERVHTCLPSALPSCAELTSRPHLADECPVHTCSSPTRAHGPFLTFVVGYAGALGPPRRSVTTLASSL